MDLEIIWHKPTKLIQQKNGLYALEDASNIPEDYGIYIFGREFGDNFGALYIGQTVKNLRQRITQQLNNAKLMTHIRTATKGYKFVYPAVFRKRTNQNVKDCIKKIEATYIRHYLLEGHDLVNDKGTRPKIQHQILSVGKSNPGPKLMKIND